LKQHTPAAATRAARCERISGGLLAGVASEGAMRLEERRELGAGNIVEDQVRLRGQQPGPILIRNGGNRRRYAR
jgi:hypothetical protein